MLLSSELATRQKVEMLRAWGFTMTEQMQNEDKDMHSWEGFGAALTQKGVLMGRKAGSFRLACAKPCREAGNLL